MRFYVRRGREGYFIADPTWARLYEMGGDCSSVPEASFANREDAEAFVALKNQKSEAAGLRLKPLECRSDCRYATGFLNEQTCDFCVRKGNIRDYYLPAPSAPPKKGQ